MTNERMITSHYRQETQVRVVKSWLEGKQLVGSLFQSLLVPMNLFSLGIISHVQEGTGQVGWGARLLSLICARLLSWPHPNSLRQESSYSTDEEIWSQRSYVTHSHWGSKNAGVPTQH